MAFADKLKELLNQRNMKAIDLARSTGLSEAAISDYINRKKEPRGQQSIAIAKALNVSLDTLWETEYGSEKADPNLDELIALFRSLDPATQKCALTQIKALNDLQKGH
ncbi:helix-turn-helix domain-containing protein [Ruminococcus sp.]|jgi:transcriptional regulator with XRE-family HTH domain|uniref:helix-turn-helix domain-containing protein n=1 Tax=Ruminococcus sp. TaxID=41978 RepID=UPI003FD72677